MLIAGTYIASNYLLKSVVHEHFARNKFSSQVKCSLWVPREELAFNKICLQEFFSQRV